MSELGARPPRVVRPVPGDASRAYVEQLARSECPALTLRRARRSERSGAPHDPIVWSEARGANVVDCDGNVFVDLTAGFGVAAIGHAHPRVVEAVRAQAGRLLHALGDLHPSDVKVQLLSRLAGIAPWPDARVILGLHGADAIEAALKTAVLKTGRPGVLAFEGGYHGLSYGALSACGYRAAFRTPFARQLNPHVVFAPWPAEEPPFSIEPVAAVLDAAPEPIGAILVEPVQGRGGVRLPPPGFLAALAELARSRGALLVADEILTGLARAGSRWLSTAADVDLLCTGKALGGGLPVSACLGRPEVMAAWGDPGSEALHTATFLGHPLGCAAALAVLDVIDEEELGARAKEVGDRFLGRLHDLERHPSVREVRGIGLLIGIELESGELTLALLHALLQRGYIALPAGADARVLQLVPPIVTPFELLEGFVGTLDELLAGDPGEAP